MDGSSTEDLFQQSLRTPRSYLLPVETNGSKTVNTANGGGCYEGDGMSVQQEPGVWGTDGLLAVPHVKIVLCLGCVVQVRQKMVQPN